jgi:hypothetical protein
MKRVFEHSTGLNASPKRPRSSNLFLALDHRDLSTLKPGNTYSDGHLELSILMVWTGLNRIVALSGTEKLEVVFGTSLSRSLRQMDIFPTIHDHLLLSLRGAEVTYNQSKRCIQLEYARSCLFRFTKRRNPAFDVSRIIDVAGNPLIGTMVRHLLNQAAPSSADDLIVKDSASAEDDWFTTPPSGVTEGRNQDKSFADPPPTKTPTLATDISSLCSKSFCPPESVAVPDSRSGPLP